jgi:hypothetical protein
MEKKAVVDLGTCKKCGTKLIRGIAMEQTYTGVPDFAGDERPVTVSPGGSGKLIACLKCTSCGWSMK